MSRQKHSVELAKHSLEMEENLPLHEKGWVIQRIGWAFILMVMVAGAIGVFGSGFISKETPQAGSFSVKYDRYYRYEAEMKIEIRSNGTHISHISLPQDYLSNFRLIRFVPEPISNHTENRDVVYNFSPSANQTVTLYVVAENFGTIKGVMKINNQQHISLHHFLYP